MSEITAAKKRKGGPAAGAKQPAPKKAKTGELNHNYQAITILIDP